MTRTLLALTDFYVERDYQEPRPETPSFCLASAWGWQRAVSLGDSTKLRIGLPALSWLAARFPGAAATRRTEGRKAQPKNGPQLLGVN
ncbi:hypothetical protein RRG08_025642 [Elysia crispata]|uniref:Uncharacterized protein n=1 Tax=Elysia crispata TaxID=231223 RepID=A0AAE0YE47_9GAST|nr:hypothetical protein RRG08_025642 [Elysia crispata]